MKPKAELCLRDYLTIHVHPSVLLGDHYRKPSLPVSTANPLMNNKLKLLKGSQKKQNVKVVQSNLPSRAYSRNRKLESIPLLQNMRALSTDNLRVGRDKKTMQYQLVYQKGPKQSQANCGPKDVKKTGLNTFDLSLEQKLVSSRQTHRSSHSLHAPQASFFYKTEQRQHRRVESATPMEVNGWRPSVTYASLQNSSPSTFLNRHSSSRQIYIQQ